MPTINSLKYRFKSLVTSAQVVGYPKSGNTWLRVMITKSLIKGFGLKEKSQYYSDFHIFLRPAVANILWSHGTKNRRSLVGSTNLDPYIKTNRRTILLVRDPRDVLVSFYHHELFRNGREKYSEIEWREMFPGVVDGSNPSISQYIRSETRGIRAIVYFMNYWLSRKDEFSDFLLLRYEDMLAEPNQQAKHIFEFLRLPATEQVVEFASAESRFDNMRKMELDGGFPEADLARPKDVQDVRTFKTRTGKSGSYIDLIKGSDLKFVNTLLREQLNPVFGYR